MKWEMYSEIVKLGEDGKYYVEADYEINGQKYSRNFLAENATTAITQLREFRNNCKQVAKESKDAPPF